MRIDTKDPQTGKPNGHVITVWTALHQPQWRPDQVYVTAVAPQSKKGPHLHKVRRGFFCCIKGNVRIVTKSGDEYATVMSGEAHNYQRAIVMPGTPCCIYNDGDEEALVLNMPWPAWSEQEPDEWPVEDWTHK